MVVLKLFLIFSAIAIAISVIWNIIGVVILSQDIKRAREKLRLQQKKLANTSNPTIYTPVTRYVVTNEQRTWLGSIGSKIPAHYNSLILGILQRGFYTPTEREKLNEIRQMYVDTIKKDTLVNKTLDGILNDLNKI